MNEADSQQQETFTIQMQSTIKIIGSKSGKIKKIGKKFAKGLVYIVD